MKILITGGTGLIGKFLTNALIQDGYEISVLTRNPQKAKAVLPKEVSSFMWDGTSSKGWESIIEETDAVINLAGESIAGESLVTIFTQRWSEEQKKRIRNSRVNSGRAMIEAIKKASVKPKTLIQASAVGFYGPSGEGEIIESHPAGDDFLAGVCKDWEDSTYEVEDMGLRRVTIRSGLVLASSSGILPIMLLPFRLFVGGPIGGGKQYVPWIHIQDQVDAIRFLLQSESAQGPYNLTSPKPVSNADFGRITGQVLGRPNWFPTPGIALKVALGEKASLVLEGQRAIPQRLLEAGFDFKYKDLGTALQNLDI